MKQQVLALCLACTSYAPAQIFEGGGILFGGGYLENPGKGYGFVQFRGDVYEDDAFTHTLFLEVLAHFDDATLTYPSGGGFFTEDGDISFVNFTVNYEFEAKLNPWLSAYFGGGIGGESITLQDEFQYDVDDDVNFTAQVFMGLRSSLESGWTFQAGVRHLFREDFSLLGDQFVTEDSWAFELGAGFSF